MAGQIWSTTGLVLDNGPATTAGVIAMANLDARIEGLTLQATRGSLTGEGWSELVELTALRGHVLGRIDQAERAVSLAGSFVEQAPRDPRSFLARARMAAFFHRFSAALADLDIASALGLGRRDLDQERAEIYQAIGRYDEALAIHRRRVLRQPDSGALAALARHYVERGELVEAAKWFRAARHRFRGTSPFPLATLELQCGQIWLTQDDLGNARIWLESAVRRLPAHVPAQGHLAELDVAEGQTVEAIQRLRSLALASDDPEYAAQLARILSGAHGSAEALSWRADATARYEALTVRHPEAYADHAAEFWLTIGGDPQRALRLAQQNLASRPTPRTRALVTRAMRKVSSGQSSRRSAP
jgi:tetratricopeptide (TPR) repeat protein